MNVFFVQPWLFGSYYTKPKNYGKLIWWLLWIFEYFGNFYKRSFMLVSCFLCHFHLKCYYFCLVCIIFHDNMHNKLSWPCWTIVVCCSTLWKGDDFWRLVLCWQPYGRLSFDYLRSNEMVMGALSLSIGWDW